MESVQRSRAKDTVRDVRPSRRVFAFLAIVGTVVGSALVACSDESPSASAASNDGSAVDERTSATDSAALDVAAPDANDAAPIDARVPNTTCRIADKPLPAPEVRFEWLPTKQLASPLQIAQAPNDSSRWFLALRSGVLATLAVASMTEGPATVADLTALAGVPVATTGEGGFLGFAFHPRFADNGRVYVSWTSADGGPLLEMRSRVGYLTSADGGLSFTSYTNLLTFDQPYVMHKGGGIAFGRDGLLYLSFGDGGIGGSAQSTSGYYGRILRVDVDNAPPGQPYGIPLDNPFRLGGGEPATFAYGLRNPFRLSIDRETNQLWVGDVGDARWEEIDRVELGGNYGWACLEGNHLNSGPHPVACPLGLTNLLPPVVEHEHVAGVSPSRAITGGVVYRGEAMSDLVGTYIYGDVATQEIFGLSFDPASGAPQTKVLNPAGPYGGWVQFAEDAHGEIVAVDLYGWLYRMVARPTGDAGTPAAHGPAALLSKTGCVDALDPHKPAPGVIPFGVRVEAWSDGATAERWLALPDDAKVHVAGSATDPTFELPNGAVLLEMLSRGGAPIETRLLTRYGDGTWGGFSYEWRADGDAHLLPANKLNANGWYFPSRAECIRCHNAQAGGALGFEVRQLHRDFDNGAGQAGGQLESLSALGLFDAPLGDTSKLPTFTTTTEGAARSWLHVTCASCHRPELATPRADFDARITTPLASSKLCGAAPLIGDLGVPSAKLLAPASPATSLISIRAHASNAHRMPPIPRAAHDPGLTVLDQWIGELPACP